METLKDLRSVEDACTEKIQDIMDNWDMGLLTFDEFRGQILEELIHGGNAVNGRDTRDKKVNISITYS